MKKQLTHFKFFAIAFLLLSLFINVDTFAQNWVSAQTGSWSDPNTWVPQDINKTGTLSITSTSKNVTGIGTAFTTELSVGSVIYTQLGVYIGTVATITNDTTLKLSSSYNSATISNSAYKTIGGIPGPGANVTIVSNHTVYVDDYFTCASLAVAPTNNNLSKLLFTVDGYTLTVNGVVTLGNSGANNRKGQIDMTAGGTLICQGFALANTGGNLFTAGTGTVELTTTNTLPSSKFTSFNNLTVSSGTTTAGVNFTVNGILNLASSSTLNMSTFKLLGTTLTTAGTGLLRTQNTTTTAMPTGITWNGNVQYDGVNQTVATGTYNNLILANSGNKTLNGTLTINGDLSIATGVKANLKAFTSSANSLTLDGGGTPSGSWGSTSSPATNTNNIYFSKTTGIINVATGTCVALPTITTDVAASAVCFSKSNQTTPLAYSATTGSPVTYSISWDASPANSFVAVVDAVLPASPIFITVPKNTPGGTYTGTITVKNAYGCESIGTTFTVTVGAIAWSSTATNTNWLDASNWTCGLPVTTSDVVINAGTFQPVIASSVKINSLTIASGASVTVSSNYDLTVTDKIVTEGTLNVQNNANLLQTNDVVNTGAGTAIVDRNSSSLLRLDYTLWSSPVNGSQSLQNFSPMTSSTRFYEYVTATNLYASVPSTNTFDLAKGYLIRMPNNWSSTVASSWTGQFSGTANNGTFTHTLSTATDGYNAVGNPYPSALNVTNFINGNLSNIEGTLWFWRKTNDDSNPVSYSTITLAGSTITKSLQNGAVYPNGNLISVGQGFLVKALSTTLNYNNTMRSNANVNQFFKGAPINRYWIELKDAADVSYGQNLIAYIPGATKGYDNGYDGLFFNDTKTSLFTMSDDKEVVIQARSEFEPQDVLPLIFKTDVAGTYTINLTEKEGLFNNGQTVYLKDNLLNKTQILNEGGYTFATEAGNFTERFNISYQAALSVDQTVFNENNVVIYKQNQDLIVNSGTITMSNVKVYDLQGRLLVNLKDINASQTKITTVAKNQVLVVKITSIENGIVTKKVMH